MAGSSADATPLRLRDGAAEWSEQDGEAVLLDLDRSWYVGLNRSATALWTALAEGTTRAQLVDRLRNDFGVPEDRAGADVDAFLDECRRRGLLG